MRPLLISGGTIVNEGRRFIGYIVVQDGIITEIGEGAPDTDRNRACHGGKIDRIDATGKIVMPGVIDAHVHFREPGLTCKGDMASESAAAVAGGVTSVLEMPNTVPQTTTSDALERKFDLADGRMHTNYSFFLGATTENIAKVKLFNFSSGITIPGVKLFIGSSTGGMLVDDPHTLSALFAEFDGVIAAHCEDENIIRSNTEFYHRQTEESGVAGTSATAALHPLIRSSEACYLATARAIELADKYGTKLHVCHISTERELALLDAVPLIQYGDTHIVAGTATSVASGTVPASCKRITAEACVPHLWFTDKDYARLGNFIKCNPSIKSACDRAALRKALSPKNSKDVASLLSARTDMHSYCDSNGYGGKIDLVATDHAPHTREEKLQGYWQAPSGIPSIQYSLSVMFELAMQGIVTLETIVEKMCHAPAIRFGIVGRGFLRTGYKADITIVDPAAKLTNRLQQEADANRKSDTGGWVIAPENILSKCGWSPWEGVLFGSRVVCTIVGGLIVYDGERVSEVATGERLAFAR